MQTGQTPRPLPKQPDIQTETTGRILRTTDQHHQTQGEGRPEGGSRRRTPKQTRTTTGPDREGNQQQRGARASPPEDEVTKHTRDATTAKQKPTETNHRSNGERKTLWDPHKVPEQMCNSACFTPSPTNSTTFLLDDFLTSRSAACWQSSPAGFPVAGTAVSDGIAQKLMAKQEAPLDSYISFSQLCFLQLLSFSPKNLFGPQTFNSFVHISETRCT